MGNKDSLHDRLVVITGASSGIGRATAHAFAEAGATVVLAARGESALEDARAECEALSNGRAIAVPTDVADDGAVKRLAQEAQRAGKGRIDIWVNNAGVLQLGAFEKTPPDVFRQVIETNLFGYVHGARAALPIFRRQGEGVLVNVSSMTASTGQSPSAAYVTSKFAVRGFSIALRQELLDSPGIHVCTVLPAAIDTPIFQHAANYTGRAVRAMRPTYDPYDVAREIVKLAHRPRREVFVGAVGRLLALQHAIAPDLTERLIAFGTERQLFEERRTRNSRGNLFKPAKPAEVRGGWVERQGSGQAAFRVGAAALAALPIGAFIASRLRG
jgi:NAD(P)-dependent dehydrogenase (short-subunit alcohol dehydrogenase family)